MTRRSLRGPGARRAVRILLVFPLLLLASCRLVITTDATGHILSQSGDFDCDRPSCAFPITREVTETFTAVPAEGYRFAYWRGLCRRATTEVCNARVMPLPEKFRKHDGDIALVAVFEPSDTRRPWYRDRDQDGYGTPVESRMAFERPAGFVSNTDDCDDTNAEIRPWAKESNYGLDNDCDGYVD